MAYVDAAFLQGKVTKTSTCIDKTFKYLRRAMMRIPVFKEKLNFNISTGKSSRGISKRLFVGFK